LISACPKLKSDINGAALEAVLTTWATKGMRWE
jgi:hypothetical protein